jgi:hypothetical protein
VSKKTSGGQVMAPAAQDEGDDDPDLPPMSGGRIDKQAYLQLRQAYLLRLRGIDLKNPPDPKIRQSAIRSMQLEEQRIYGNQGELTAPGMAGIAPFSPPSATTWTELGPAPIPNGQTSPSVAVSGRVAAIAVHPSNPNIVYVGTAQGGLYRSLDGGNTWTPLMDSAQSLAIGSIAIAPSQPSTVYVGTGEANLSLDSFFGVGVYRIDNADTSPVLVGPLNLDAGNNDVFTGRSIPRILVDPGNANNIFVASSSGASGLDGSALPTRPVRGVFRSTNALAAANSVTFARLTGTAGPGNGNNRLISDIALDPGNSNNLLAFVDDTLGAGDGGVYRSTNALASDPTTVAFTRTLTISTGSINGKLSINSTTVLAGTGESSGTVYESTDGGATWPTTFAAAAGFCGGQCFYDLVVTLKPDDANTFFLGGAAGSLMLKKTIDGGTSFTTPNVSLHADTHAIVYAPSNFSIMYEGNDGGIWSSADGGNTWTSRNTTGFSATQFQSLALHPLDREYMIGGTQDNGTEFRHPDTSWTRAQGGDGGYTAIDQNATDNSNVTLYHTFFNSSGSQIEYEHVTGTANAFPGGGWTPSGCFGSVSHNGITCADSVLFYAPMVLGPGSPNTVYFGSDRLYRSSDGGANNFVVSQAPIVTGVPVSTIAIAPQDDNYRIVGLRNGQVWATTTGSTTLTNITGSWPVNVYVARAMIDPNNKNTAYVTLDDYGLPAGQHVWKTTNLNGVPPTWTASGNGIPDVPTNSMVIDPANSNSLYAATDIGVYHSSDGGSSWSPFGTGLPRIAVFDIAIQNPNRVVRAATHGRGLWEIAAADQGATHFQVTAPSTASATLPFSITVTALDATNTVVPSYTGTVHFTTTDGAATLPANYTFTGGDAGVHTFSVTLRTLGGQTVTTTDTVITSITGTSGTITVGPGPATHFTLTGAPASIAAGSGFTITVTAKDSLNNTATGYTGTAHFTSSDAQATLPVNYTFSAGDNGAHVFSFVLGTVGAGRTITATDTVTGSINGTSTGITVTPGPTTHFNVLPSLTTVTAGAAFNVTVTAQDAYNNTATAYPGTVHFTSGDNQATLPADSTLTSGTGTFAVTLKTAGQRSVAATDKTTPSINGVSSLITVNNAAATTYSMTSPPTATAGTPFTVRLVAQDQFGNTAKNYTGTVHFTSSDVAGGVVLPLDYTYLAGDNGQKIFSNAFTLQTGGGQTLTATDKNTASITATNPITVTSDAFLTPQGRNISMFRPKLPLLVAAFTDADGTETGSHFTATIDWGDGTTPDTCTLTLTTCQIQRVSSSNVFNVVGTHTYKAKKVFAVKVTLSDSGGSVANASSTARFFPMNGSH